MIGTTGLRLGIIAAIVVAAASMAILAGPAYAQEPTLSVSDGTAEPGGTGTVTISASDVGDPADDFSGVGAWTIDLAYPDAAVASVVDCQAGDVGTNLCNENFDSDSDTTPDSVRLAGADPNGVTGDIEFAVITLQCENAEASAALDLEASVFSDATIGNPQPMNPTVTDGTFTCAIQPTATSTTVPASATPTVGVIAGTGTGPTDSGTGIGWVIAALAGAGLALFAGLGALRLRMRRA